MAADADTPDGELRQTAETEAPPTSADTETTEPKPTAEQGVSTGCADDGEEYNAAVGDETDDESDEAAPVKQPMSHVRLATVVGLVVVVALAALVGWLGFRAYQSHQAQEQRELFVQVARQGALNLTTIDWQHADTDVQRILDSGTGTFYDDFSKRQQPFIDVVKKAQATSKGTINEAGLESQSGDEAQVLVAVSVNTSNLGAAKQETRSWRMRVSVQKVAGDVKISNIAFVP